MQTLNLNPNPPQAGAQRRRWPAWLGQQLHRLRGKEADLDAKMLTEARRAQSSSQALDAILKYAYEPKLQQILAMRVRQAGHAREAYESGHVTDSWARSRLLEQMERTGETGSSSAPISRRPGPA
ncbi:MAG: hypothetical protein KGH63_00875 [Candidatus Micrarchaeota archaeon]|nr:hypothetical protein [Candidatus Micrarchaeota archaeon]